MDTAPNSHDVFSLYRQAFEVRRSDEMGLHEYLDACRTDRAMYALPQERLLKAIGKPTIIDTREDPRLGRIFQNRILKRYPTFSEFYGIEAVMERIVSFLIRAAQGLEEKKQVLYLLGPVGGGKSSLADRLKALMEFEPFYALAGSPIFESPLGLFSEQHQRRLLEDHYHIDPQRIPRTMSSWAMKRIRDYERDLIKFRVVRLFPSILNEIAIAVTTPGDENNQEISTLVGKVDIRKLEEFSQNDPDAYSYSGGLCRSNQGILDFVEMFKAHIKTLNPLLTATQEGFYKGTEEIGALPYSGIILAHSNETEWQKFKNEKTNEAFIDRVNIIKVPYCLRVDEEVEIYAKLIRNSELGNASCAPDTLKLLAAFSVLSRLKDPIDKLSSTWRAKMRTYNGENLKDTDLKAKPIHEYLEHAGVDEGMTGISTRFAFKTLARVFNFGQEIAANPVHLFAVLEEEIKQAQFPTSDEQRYLGAFLKDVLVTDYAEFLDKEIRAAFVESYEDYGQTVLDRYFLYADAWCQDQDYRDPDTQVMYNRDQLNAELEKIEKPAGITNAKEFRNEVVQFTLRYRAKNNEQNPPWRSYQKIREVIEKNIFAKDEELLPVISFGKKPTDEQTKKHEGFVKRMTDKGYTLEMVRLLVEWHMRMRKNK